MKFRCPSQCLKYYEVGSGTTCPLRRRASPCYMHVSPQLPSPYPAEYAVQPNVDPVRMSCPDIEFDSDSPKRCQESPYAPCGCVSLDANKISIAFKRIQHTLQRCIRTGAWNTCLKC